jgi:hypothetical protein
MTKALWLTVAQCCGEKENKEKGVGWVGGDSGVWKRMRDEALVCCSLLIISKTRDIGRKRMLI